MGYSKLVRKKQLRKALHQQLLAAIDSPVYRIFGDLKFVTDLGFSGALSPKITSVFVHLGRSSR